MIYAKKAQIMVLDILFSIIIIILLIFLNFNYINYKKINIENKNNELEILEEIIKINQIINKNKHVLDLKDLENVCYLEINNQKIINKKTNYIQKRVVVYKNEMKIIKIGLCKKE